MTQCEAVKVPDLKSTHGEKMPAESYLVSLTAEKKKSKFRINILYDRKCE